MNRTNIHKIISWYAALLWMAFIFFLSHQSGETSSGLSSGIVQIIIRVIETILPFLSLDIETFHFFIRKSGHFFAYFVLGIFLVHALLVGRDFTIRVAAIALVTAVLYAISDEIHQLFVPGRSGEVRDVLIDSAGSATGIVMYISTVFLWNRFLKMR